MKQPRTQGLCSWEARKRTCLSHVNISYCKVWTLIRSCSKISQKGKSCLKFLEAKKVATNAKSCSKVAEHNRDMPTLETSMSSLYFPGSCIPVNAKFSYFLHYLQSTLAQRYTIFVPAGFLFRRSGFSIPAFRAIIKLKIIRQIPWKHCLSQLEFQNFKMSAVDVCRKLVNIKLLTVTICNLIWRRSLLM
jgi:hypothetical protein